LVAERVRQHGKQALAERGDICSEEDVRCLLDAPVGLGPLTGLVSSAPITGNNPGRLDEQHVDSVRRGWT
jgi:hypothetical protein